MNNVKRMPIRLSDPAARTIQELEAETGMPTYLLIEQGISLRKYVYDELKKGNTFLLQHPDKTLAKIHFNLDVGL